MCCGFFFALSLVAGEESIDTHTLKYILSHTQKHTHSHLFHITLILTTSSTLACTHTHRTHTDIVRRIGTGAAGRKSQSSVPAPRKRSEPSIPSMQANPQSQACRGVDEEGSSLPLAVQAVRLQALLSRCHRVVAAAPPQFL